MKSLFRLFARRQSAAAPPVAVPDAEVETLLQQGSALEQRGDIDGARALYQQAAERMPKNARVQLELGNTQFMLGRSSDAIASYRRCLELQPGNVDAHLNLGAVMLARQDALRAEQSYRDALALRPDSADAWAGLGCALEAKGAPASDAFERALALNPAHAGAAARLAQSLRARGQAHAALRVLDMAARANPSSRLIVRTRAELDGGIGNYESAIAGYRRLLEQDVHDAAAWSNLLWTLNFLPQIGAGEVLTEHVKFGDCMAASVGAAAIETSPAWPRKLRIGYVSPDFNRHPVSVFIEPVLREHDRARFEVHCFYDFDSWDEITDTIRRHADRWHDIAGLADEAVAEKIAVNEIDVLIDLAGHSAHNRMRLFALKPAPLQFSWLGYLCTTGLRTIDYRLCDRHTDPAGLAEQWQVEKPAWLPHSQWCYQPQVPLPDPGPLPLLRNGYCTFGSFNQESKLSEVALGAWARVLAAIPRSRMRVVGVSCDAVAERILACFGACGVAPERVDIVGRIAIDEYFASYRDVDIALDTFPYNGATTSCDALIMGVPVATVFGERSIARGGMSLLSTIGLDDWIAASPAALAELLQRQIADPARLVALRAQLPQRMRGSALMDAAGFTRDLERVLTEAWLDHLRVRAPNRS